MQRIVSSAAGVLVVAVVGAGCVTGSLLARADATGRAARAEATAAALRLAEVRLDLCAGVTEVAITRVRGGSEGGDQLDTRAVLARWEATYRASAATLDDLRTGPAAVDAQHARDALTDLGVAGPEDVEGFLQGYATPCSTCA